MHNSIANTMSRWVRLLILVLIIWQSLTLFAQNTEALDTAILSASRLIQKSEFEAAKKILTQLKSQKTFDENNLNGNTVNLLLGIIYEQQGFYKLSLRVYNQALNAAVKRHDIKAQSDILNNIGILYSDQDAYDTALTYYSKALNLRIQNKDHQAVLNSKLSIANIFYLKGSYQAAYEKYFDVYIAPALTDTLNKTTVAFNLGLVSQKMGLNEKALFYFNESERLSALIGDLYGQALCYNSKASLLVEQKKYTQALKLAIHADSVYQTIGVRKEESGNKIFLGAIHDSLQQFEKAFHYYEQAIDISKTINAKIETANAYKALSGHFALQGMYREALAQYQLYNEIQNQMISDDLNQKMAQLETEYRLNQKNEAIQELQQQQQFKAIQYQTQIRNFWIVVLLSLLILMLVLGILFWKNAKRRHLLLKQNHDLELKALRSQMNPHFVFNALSSIGGFIVEDNKKSALNYLTTFSKLIRSFLENSGEKEIALPIEIDNIRNYLALQKLRYNEQLDYKVEIDEQVDTEVSIPPWLIQPFIENAIIHGIAPKESPGMVAVSFKMAQNQLVCSITDNGVGLHHATEQTNEGKHKSVSTRNIQERIAITNQQRVGQKPIEVKIETLYNDGHPSGTQVVLVFPI